MEESTITNDSLLQTQEGRKAESRSVYRKHQKDVCFPGPGLKEKEMKVGITDTGRVEKLTSSISDSSPSACFNRRDLEQFLNK